MSKLNEKIALSRTLSLKKLSNAYSIHSSYKKSKRLGTPIMKGLPFSISIEPTTACNLGCPECPSGLKQFTRPTGNISTEKFNSFIDGVKSHLIYLNMYFQGEPYIHPKFLDMIGYASSQGIFTSTSTNAHFISKKNAEATVKSGLNRIIISIDGTSQDTYESYRVNGSLEKVIEGAKNLVEAKKRNKKGPEIIFQFLVVKPNEHQIDEVKRLGKDLNVDQVLFKTAQIYDFQNGNPLIPSLDKYSRYKKLPNGTYVIKNSLDNQCWKMWHSCVITWDGEVVPCCFDKDAKYSMGNAFEIGLKEIWNNKSYHQFRKSLLTSRSNIDICKNCSEGTKVWA